MKRVLIGVMLALGISTLVSAAPLWTKAEQKKVYVVFQHSTLLSGECTVDEPWREVYKYDTTVFLDRAKLFVLEVPTVMTDRPSR